MTQQSKWSVILEIFKLLELFLIIFGSGNVFLHVFYEFLHGLFLIVIFETENGYLCLYL